MIKIYFDSKPLILTDEITEEMEGYLQHEETVFMDTFNTEGVKKMIHQMGLPSTHAGVFLYQDVDALLLSFKETLTLVIAAGGLVHTKDNQLLMIFRRGKLDLPKGKLDPGEEIEACALREIAEETGVSDVQIERPLCITYHTYELHGKHFLKESHWFLMRTAGQEPFSPQQEEDIEKCEWVPAGKITPYLEHTHASILDVVNSGLRWLQ